MYRNFRSKFAVLQEGREPLPCCKMCKIYMPEGRIIKHHRTVQCFNNTDMRLRRRGVEVAGRFPEI